MARLAIRRRPVHQIRLHQIRLHQISLAIAILSLAACTSPPPLALPTVPSPPPGPVLDGRLIVQTEDFAVWTVSQEGTTVEAKKLAAASGAAALSPNGKTLAYFAGADLVFKDVAGGTERHPRLAPRAATKGDCLRWSPDSSRVEYLDTGG